MVPVPPDPPPDEGRSPARSPAGGSLALTVLVGLVLLSPWPFGSVHPVATRAIAIVALATTLVALAVQRLAARRPAAPASDGLSRLAFAAVGLWLLGSLQLVPIPQGLHALVARGSAGVWHPAERAAAEALGAGPFPISVYPAATTRWLVLFAAVAGLALAATPALHGRRRFLAVSVATVGSATAVSLYAFLARLWFGDRVFGTYESLVRPFGPFVSKNHFAGYVEMAALLAVGLATGLAAESRDRSGALSWIGGPRAGRIVGAWAVAAILVLAVPVSLSRGGVVSLAAGLLAFVLLRTASGGAAQDGAGRRRDAARRTTLALAAGFGAVALVVAALAVVLPESARARIGTIAQGGGDGSSSYRVSLWRDTLRLAASSPLLGSGLGAYADAIPRFKTGAGDVRVEHAESDVLELAAESGLLGLSTAAAALVLVFRTGWRRIRLDPHRLSRAVRMGGLAALAALTAHSFLDFNLRIPSNALLAALVTAIVLSPASDEDEESDTPRRTNLRPLAFAAVATLSLVAALAVPWTDSRSFADGLSLRTGTLRRSTAEREVVSHLRQRPADAEAWLVLAWLRLTDGQEPPRPLTEHALRLDPTDVRLQRAAARIVTR